MKYTRIVLIGLAVVIFNACGIHNVARDGDLEGMKAYMRDGGNVNIRKTNLLSYALLNRTSHNRYEMVKLLLENGANAKICCDYDLLSFAIFTKDPRIVKILIDYDVEYSIDLDEVSPYIAHANKYSSTSCGYEPSVCKTVAYARKYYKEKQSEKINQKEEKKNQVKNSQVDDLLGI